MFDWSIGVVWAAFAYATAPSERTFAAMPALIGIARLAFTSDIAARSGSSSPASSCSSSRVNARYSSPMEAPFVASVDLGRHDRQRRLDGHPKDAHLRALR